MLLVKARLIKSKGKEMQDTWLLRCFKHAYGITDKGGSKALVARHYNRKVRKCFPRGKNWPPTEGGQPDREAMKHV